MSIWKQKANNGGGGNFEVPPEGNQPAVLVAIIDLGTQREEFAGKDPRSVRKVYFCWELTDAPATERKGNLCIGAKLTLSLNEKSALTAMLKTWGKKLAEGEEFDISTLLGKACMVTVVHETKGDNTYANFGGVTPVPKALHGKTSPAGFAPFVWEIADEAGKAREELKALNLRPWLPRSYGEELSAIVQRSAEWVALMKQPALAGAGVATTPAGNVDEIGGGDADETSF